MTCPKCMKSDSVVFSGDSHYVCREGIGCGSQFEIIYDKKIHFPYNVMFNDRQKHEFFRKPYLQLPQLDAMNIGD